MFLHSHLHSYNNSVRSDPLLHQGKPRPGLVIHKVTSLDDTIDTVLEGQRSLGALYVFAGYDEAKYLSQFIPARAAFVNHIPPELQSKYFIRLTNGRTQCSPIFSRSCVSSRV